MSRTKTMNRPESSHTHYQHSTTTTKQTAVATERPERQGTQSSQLSLSELDDLFAMDYFYNDNGSTRNRWEDSLEADEHAWNHATLQVQHTGESSAPSLAAAAYLPNTAPSSGHETQEARAIPSAWRAEQGLSMSMNHVKHQFPTDNDDDMPQFNLPSRIPTKARLGKKELKKPPPPPKKKAPARRPRVRRVHEPAQRVYVTFTDKDVLCQRGGFGNKHPGNITYHAKKRELQSAYKAAIKSQKLPIAKQLVAAVHKDNGRFLEQDPGSKQWFIIDDKKAHVKAGQALRENYTKAQRDAKRAKYRKKKKRLQKKQAGVGGKGDDDDDDDIEDSEDAYMEELGSEAAI